MRTWPVVPVFLAWTVLVWAGRIRNILGDDDLTSGGRAWRIGAAVLFVVLASAAYVARRRSAANATALLGALVVWTVGWWTVRGVGILLDGNHAVGFKVVHTILMIGSIALAVWAWSRRDG